MKFRLSLLALMLIAVCAPWAVNIGFGGFAVPADLPMALMLLVATFSAAIKSEKIYFGRPMVPFALYVTLIGLSVFWSLTASNYSLWYNLAVWTFYLVCFFGVINFLRDPRSMRWFAYASGLGALVTLPQLSLFEFEQGITAGRYAVEGQNGNFTAYVLAGAFFVMALTLHYLKHGRVSKLLLLGGIGLVGIALMLLGTRGAQLSVFLSGVTIFGGRLVTRSFARFASSLAIMAAVAFSLGLLTSFLVWLDSFSARSTGDLSGRLVVWVEALDYIARYPFFGIGPGSFRVVGTLEIGVHNVFLLVLLDTGVIGFAVFLWFIYEVWRAIVSQGKDGQRIFFALMMYWLPMAVSGHWEIAPYSWGVIGFAIAMARLLQRQRQMAAQAAPLAAPPVPGGPALAPGRGPVPA